MDKSLDYYINEFEQLNCNKIASMLAPHKPILLLSVITHIETGKITSNFIGIDSQLEDTFHKLWKVYTNNKVFYNPVFTTPFFHLSNENFWHLVLKQESLHAKEIKYNSGNLKKYFQGAIIDKELFAYLCNKTSREKLKQTLINTYLIKSNIKQSDTLNKAKIFKQYLFLF